MIKTQRARKNNRKRLYTKGSDGELREMKNKIAENKKEVAESEEHRIEEDGKRN